MIEVNNKFCAIAKMQVDIFLLITPVSYKPVLGLSDPEYPVVKAKSKVLFAVKNAMSSNSMFKAIVCR